MLTSYKASINEYHEITSPKFVSDASNFMVAKLVDAYLAEVGWDRNVPLSKFIRLAESISSFS